MVWPGLEQKLLEHKGRRYRAVVANECVVHLEIEPIQASLKNRTRWRKVALGAKRSRVVCAIHGLRPCMGSGLME